MTKVPSLFTDVYTFIDRVKDIVVYKGEDMVRTNISACLHGTALHHGGK